MTSPGSVLISSCLPAWAWVLTRPGLASAGGVPCGEDEAMVGGGQGYAAVASSVVRCCRGCK
jgi:hypothetical protein